MALDKEYFDAIDLEVVKKKYYNAKKVEAVFRDIQRQAAALEADNERMRAAISALADRRVELGDAVISGQGVYRGIVEKANARAQEIVGEAERRAAEIEKRSQQRQEEAVRRTERLFNAMKRQYQSAIDAINGEWQRYLCSLDSEEAETPEALAAAAQTRPYLSGLCLPVSDMGEALRQIQQQKGGIYTLYKKALEEGQAIQEEQQKGAI